MEVRGRAEKMLTNAHQLVPVTPDLIWNIYIFLLIGKLAYQRQMRFFRSFLFSAKMRNVFTTGRTHETKWKKW